MPAIGTGSGKSAAAERTVRRKAVKRAPASKRAAPKRRSTAPPPQADRSAPGAADPVRIKSGRTFANVEEYQQHQDRKAFKQDLRAKIRERAETHARYKPVTSVKEAAAESRDFYDTDKPRPSRKERVADLREDRREHEANERRIKRAGEKAVKRAEKRTQAKGVKLQRAHRVARRKGVAGMNTTRERAERAIAQETYKQRQAEQQDKVVRDERSKRRGGGIGQLLENAKDELVDTITGAPASAKEMASIAAEQAKARVTGLGAGFTGHAPKTATPKTDKLIQDFKETSPVVAAIQGDFDEALGRAKERPIAAIGEASVVAGPVGAGVRAGTSVSRLARLAPDERAKTSFKAEYEESKRRSRARPDLRVPDEPGPKQARKDVRAAAKAEREQARARPSAPSPDSEAPGPTPRAKPRTYARNAAVRTAQKAADRTKAAAGRDPNVATRRQAKRHRKRLFDADVRNVQAAGIGREEAALRVVESATRKMSVPERAATELLMNARVRRGSEAEDLAALRRQVSDGKATPYTAENVKIIDGLLSDFEKHGENSVLRRDRVVDAAENLARFSRGSDERQAALGYGTSEQLRFITLAQGLLARGEIRPSSRQSGEPGEGEVPPSPPPAGPSRRGEKRSIMDEVAPSRREGGAEAESVTLGERGGGRNAGGGDARRMRRDLEIEAKDRTAQIVRLRNAMKDARKHGLGNERLQQLAAHIAEHADRLETIEMQLRALEPRTNRPAHGEFVGGDTTDEISETRVVPSSPESRAGKVEPQETTATPSQIRQRRELIERERELSRERSAALRDVTDAREAYAGAQEIKRLAAKVREVQHELDLVGHALSLLPGGRVGPRDPGAPRVIEAVEPGKLPAGQEHDVRARRAEDPGERTEGGERLGEEARLKRAIKAEKDKRVSGKKADEKAEGVEGAGGRPQPSVMGGEEFKKFWDDLVIDLGPQVLKEMGYLPDRPASENYRIYRDRVRSGQARPRSRPEDEMDAPEGSEQPGELEHDPSPYAGGEMHTTHTPEGRDLLGEIMQDARGREPLEPPDPDAPDLRSFAGAGHQFFWRKVPTDELQVEWDRRKAEFDKYNPGKDIHKEGNARTLGLWMEIQRRAMGGEAEPRSSARSGQPQFQAGSGIGSAHWDDMTAAEKAAYDEAEIAYQEGLAEGPLGPEPSPDQVEGVDAPNLRASAERARAAREEPGFEPTEAEVAAARGAGETPDVDPRDFGVRDDPPPLGRATQGDWEEGFEPSREEQAAAQMASRSPEPDDVMTEFTDLLRDPDSDAQFEWTDSRKPVRLPDLEDAAAAWQRPGFLRGSPQSKTDDRRLRAPEAGHGYNPDDLLGELGGSRIRDDLLQRERRMTFSELGKAVIDRHADGGRIYDADDTTAMKALDARIKELDESTGFPHEKFEYGGDFVILPEYLAKRVKGQLAEDGRVMVGRRWVTRQFIRATLPFSVLWHAGNAVDLYTRLALTTPPGSFTDGKAMHAALEQALSGPDMPPHLRGIVLDSLKGHFGSRQTVRDPRLTDVLRNTRLEPHGVVQNGLDRFHEFWKSYGGGKVIDKAFDVSSQLESWAVNRVIGAQAKRYAHDLGIAVGEHGNAMAELAGKLAEDPMKVHELQNRVLEVVGDFATRSPVEKQVIAGIDPFWKWFRASTKFVLKTLPTNHPKRTALMFIAASMTADERAKSGLNYYWDEDTLDRLQVSLGYRRQREGFLAGGLGGGDSVVPTMPLTSFGEVAGMIEDPARAAGRFGSLIGRPVASHFGYYGTPAEIAAKALPGGGEVSDLEYSGDRGVRTRNMAAEMFTPGLKEARRFGEKGGRPDADSWVGRPSSTRTGTYEDSGRQKASYAKGLEALVYPFRGMPDRQDPPTGAELRRKDPLVRKGEKFPIEMPDGSIRWIKRVR